MYKKVNDMLGDIVKVTPSSKMVGDMAIFMVKNDLTPENIMVKGRDMAFPDSVVAYFKGMMGQPDGGFPEDIQKIVLKGDVPITCRPGELLKGEDFDAIREFLVGKYSVKGSMEEVISYALYPDVFEDYLKYLKEYGDFTSMGSDIYFHGLSEGETCEVKVGVGEVLVITLLQISKLDGEGYRTVTFEINGNRTEIKVVDKANKTTAQNSSGAVTADPDNDLHIASSIPGAVAKVLIKEGETVEENQTIAIIEAMKMETNITAKCSGTIEKIFIKEGESVKSGQLLAELTA